jgi:hypothetical protein
LFSELGDYENFHVRVEAKISPRGDSGLIFRVPFGVLQGRLPYEAQILGRRDLSFNTGSLWGFPGGEVTQELVKPDEWFTLEVIAQDNHIIIRVNDRTAVDFPEPSRAFSKGHFALQHLEPEGSVQFRKIEIKELPAKTDSKLVSLRSFTPGKDKLPLPLRPASGAVTVDGDAWRIENKANEGNFNVMMAQVLEGIPADGVLVLRAKVRVAAKDKRTWGSLNFGGANQVLSWDQWPDVLSRYDPDTPDWTEKETRHPVAELRKTDPPAIYLYAGLHAAGVLWLKDVELLHVPARVP